MLRIWFRGGLAASGPSWHSSPCHLAPRRQLGQRAQSEARVVARRESEVAHAQVAASEVVAPELGPGYHPQAPQGSRRAPSSQAGIAPRILGASS